jgi:hypothetical protein
MGAGRGNRLNLDQDGLGGRLTRMLTRRAMLRKGAAGAGAAAVAGWDRYQGTLRAAAQARPEVQAIIDAAATLEAMEVTYIGAVRHRASPQVGLLNLGDNAGAVRYLRAAQCEEEAHYNFLVSEGAVPASERFTFPDETFLSRSTALRALLDLEEIEIGLYMAAAREFAALGDLRLVEVAYQIGGVEGGHRVLLKELIDEYPPNDRAFLAPRFPSVAAAAEEIVATGFVGGEAPAPSVILGLDTLTGIPGSRFFPGPYYQFPGVEDRYCRGISGYIPVTTDDA